MEPELNGVAVMRTLSSALEQRHAEAGAGYEKKKSKNTQSALSDGKRFSLHRLVTAPHVNTSPQPLVLLLLLLLQIHIYRRVRVHAAVPLQPPALNPLPSSLSGRH